MAAPSLGWSRVASWPPWGEKATAAKGRTERRGRSRHRGGRPSPREQRRAARTVNRGEQRHRSQQSKAQTAAVGGHKGHAAPTSGARQADRQDGRQVYAAAAPAAHPVSEVPPQSPPSSTARPGAAGPPPRGVTLACPTGAVSLQTQKKKKHTKAPAGSATGGPKGRAGGGARRRGRGGLAGRAGSGRRPYGAHREQANMAGRPGTDTHVTGRNRGGGGWAPEEETRTSPTAALRGGGLRDSQAGGGTAAASQGAQRQVMMEWAGGWLVGVQECVRGGAS